uniref:Hedgehog/Intein (Hint) domain-containing protein n=1 Tax=viral metagenome TaxID=1070528 RepID=A0A6C0KT16_9ZZZZ
MAEHELWSFTNAMFFLILMIIVAFGIVFGLNKLIDIKNIKDNWAENRCSPMIMPFASFFGHDTSENFQFCMGKIFNNFSTPFFGSIGTIFGQFTELLQSIFNSVNSIRTIIASLGGGINVIFQEFTERISNFFFKLRLSAIRLKALFGRMYAILFSVMYMGMSGITGMTSFTNTFLFSFIDTFCFPGETPVLIKVADEIKKVAIKEVKIGDVLMPGNTMVTATFQFYSRGQPMVKLGNITVSTNHYVMHNGRPIMAGEHPHAIPLGPWDSDELLYCLNTTNHTIPMDYLTFLDYDEAPECDAQTLQWIEEKINAKKSIDKNYSYKDACFAINETAKIKTMTGLKAAKDIQIGDELTTGSKVTGIIRRQVSEVCSVTKDISVTPATLYWDQESNDWKRMGEDRAYQKTADEFLSFVVIPNSQIELEDGTRVRDYMEVCSPDSEQYYSAHLESK